MFEEVLSGALCRLAQDIWVGDGPALPRTRKVLCYYPPLTTELQFCLPPHLTMMTNSSDTAELYLITMARTSTLLNRPSVLVVEMRYQTRTPISYWGIAAARGMSPIRPDSASSKSLASWHRSGLSNTPIERPPSRNKPYSFSMHQISPICLLISGPKSLPSLQAG